ncbi:MAG TPA: leucyl aminopeptidase [Thermomicrobiales bacterium]|nr:leucyl aminopeptidase [Thermomicrobiales bacterium]
MATRTSGAPPRVAIQFGDEAPVSVETDALILAVPPGGDSWSGPLAEVDAALGGALRQAHDDAPFNGEVGKTLVVHTLGRLPARRVVLTGLAADASRTDDVRRAYGAAATAAKGSGARNAVSPAPGGGLDETARYRAATEGVLLALYDFQDYKSEKDDSRSIGAWTFLASETDAARAGVQAGFAMSAGVYLARDLVNEPGQTLYPESFARIAAEVAKENELEYTEYDEKQLVEMGATSIYDVGKGSVHPPRMMHLTYTPSGESRATIAFVGKGITFDTGGMNLKPTGGIETMKIDMSGAAAVLGAMRALAAMDLPFTVHGIIASAENMPSATAFRPGDVLTAMNGKTMEIISTDAEGRLVLADALVYAARNGAEEMIDLATLTGAKMIALGSESVAVFSNDDEFAKRVVAAGTEAGDLFWHMPLWDELKKQIKSDIADMKNTGGRPGGAITAALLLAEFTEGVPWVHLDIAGAAWADSARDYTPKGPVGIGVRALINYLEAKASG